DAQQPNNYLQHTFDLSKFAGQSVNLAIKYVTDSLVEYYGFVVDDMQISQGGNVIWQDNAEFKSTFMLNGFSRIGEYIYDTP
ncbi:hypothetical protein, partial [Streptomyces caniscabiei]|uniref:hypothetical protein n=1 Tax=Streptomyces caniscabiei TaxID=2746961 RepID=UPI0038F79378